MRKVYLLLIFMITLGLVALLMPVAHADDVIPMDPKLRRGIEVTDDAVTIKGGRPLRVGTTTSMYEDGGTGYLDDGDGDPVSINDIRTAAGGGDAAAIHDNQAGEINSVSQEGSALEDGDALIGEDAQNSYAKIKILLSELWTYIAGKQNAGTDVTADLEEETHASEHQSGGADEINVTGLTGADADDVTDDNVETMATAGASGTAPVSDGASGLSMVDIATQAELNAKVDDTAYDESSWDGDTNAPTKNALRDKIETLGSASIDDTAYGAGWDGETTTAPSKNAVYDKIETIGASGEATTYEVLNSNSDVDTDLTDGATASTVPSAAAAKNYTDSLIDDTTYNESSWDGDTDAPTKNAVRDKIEALDAEKVELTDPNADSILGWDDSDTGSETKMFQINTSDFTAGGDPFTLSIHADLARDSELPTASSLSVDDLISLSGRAEGSTTIEDPNGDITATTFDAALTEIAAAVELNTAKVSFDWDYDFADLTGTPTTLAGYGITDAQADLDVPSQAEAEAGVATTERVWTAQRIGQAIAALAGGGTDDQTASEVSFNPAGNLESENTQDAIEELDTEKAATGHDHSGTYVEVGSDDDVPENGDFGNATDLEDDGSLSADVVAAAEMADADHGDVAWSGGVATVQEVSGSNSVDSDAYVDGSIDSVHLSADSVTYEKTSGSYKAQTPETDAAADFSTTFIGANLFGGTFICDTAGTITLGSAAPGQNYTIINDGSISTVLDPDATGTEDTIVLITPTGGYDDTVAQGGTVSTSTDGAMCVVQYLAADTLLLICDDNWSAD